MRVLITIQPSHAHLWPVTPCAWALQAAGHEVRVATHASFAGSVIAAGLTPVSLGNASDLELRMRPDARPPNNPQDVLHYADVLGLDAQGREHWVVFYQYLLTALSDYVRPDLSEAADLIAFAQAWQPDLVIWDPTMAAGPLAARACGAAHARFLMALDYPGWCLDRLAEGRDKLLAAGLSENPLADLVRPIADKYGIELDNEMLFGQWSIDPMPTGMALPSSATTLPMRYVPYTGAEHFPQWLHQQPDRPRVALTLGESTRRFIKGDWGRTPKVLEAVADLDIEVVATLNNQQLEGVASIPANVRQIEWVSLTQLAPTCSAIIHHGGGGTFAVPVAFNVPQIICDTNESLIMQSVEVDPRTMEDGTYRIGYEFGVSEEVVETVTTWQLPAKKLEAPPAAEYVVKRGAGARLDHQTQSVDEIAEMIRAVATDQSYRAGAQALHDTWLGMPSPTSIVPMLEALTAEHRR
ncbi:MAG: nucleotide disphospho-sugar-binding domain-containing protein [Jatrophihabitantaceae bacterium]